MRRYSEQHMQMIEEAIEERIQRMSENWRIRLRKRARIVTCHECERKFVAFHKHAKYCSASCRVLASYYRQKEREKGQKDAARQ